MDEPMTFCGYASKMTYIDESRYNFRTGVQDTNWEYLYRILNNLKDIEGYAGSFDAGSHGSLAGCPLYGCR